MENNKPLVSIIIPSLVRENLYQLAQNLTEQKCSFEFEIVIVPHKPFDKNKLANAKIKVFPQADNMGVSYYRNQGIKNAMGEILAFIDDDEMPQNDKWLQNLVDPILANGNDNANSAKVTTAGSFIPLKNGYLADSISLLGYPGGAALGFEKIWHVDENNYTNHLCSGNFAIKKDLLLKAGGFENTLTKGKEDVLLGDNLQALGAQILYVQQATVNHLPRKSFIGFLKWHIQRGKAIYEYKKVKKISLANVKTPFKTGFEALKASSFTTYFPMVLGLLVLQNICQILGFFIMKFNDKPTT